MTDILNREGRSSLMSKVRQKDTKPEMVVRSALHGAGLRYRLHAPKLPGRPDLVFPRYGVALFVHGCFWHGHDCRAGRAPSSNTAYWEAKTRENRLRDERKATELESLGWRVVVIWECETKRADIREEVQRWIGEVKGTRFTPRSPPAASR